MARARLRVAFTDLDATLLDQDYQWKAARPAMEAWAAAGGRLVLASSKTLAEMAPLQQDLLSQRPEVMVAGSPLIAENGSVVAEVDGEGQVSRVHLTGRSREEILDAAHALRRTGGHRFEGFADVGPEGVASWTGLSVEAAARACDRQGTEPIRYLGDDAAASRMAAELAEQGIRMVRGGQFHHLMGFVDKADGVRRALALLGAGGRGEVWTVALGDSPNDIAMLEAADVAVVIPHPGRRDPLPVRGRRVLRSDSSGPEGWRRSMLALLAASNGEPAPPRGT